MDEIKTITNTKEKVFLIAGDLSEKLKIRFGKYISEVDSEEYTVRTKKFYSLSSLIDYFMNKEGKADLLLLEGNLSNLSSEQVYLNLLKSRISLDFPVLFISNETEIIKNICGLGINPQTIYRNLEVGAFANIDFKEIEKFILEKYTSYEWMESSIKSSEYFSGTLTQNGLLETIFLIEKHKKSGILNIKDSRYFELFFSEGNIIDCLGNNGFIPVSGFEGLRELFKKCFERDLSYDFLSDISHADVKISDTTTTTLSKVFDSLHEIIIRQTVEIKDAVITSPGIVKFNESINDELRKTIILNNKNIQEENIIKSERKGEGKISIVTKSNLERPVEIAENVYWVSERNPKSLLQLNSFLRVFKQDTKSINLLVDPGALEYFPIVSRKVGDVISDISKVHMYSINHQDPDVGMNATFLAKMNPKSACLCTEDTWRLVQFYEIPKTSYKNVYNFEERKVTVSTGKDHVVEFVPTPYCHFVGAFALYDRKSRILFSGDLFGGLNPANNLDLVATEEHWEGIKTFHQIYMPSSKAIRRAIDTIRSLPEPPLMIAPQHGAVLVGEIMEQFLNRLYNLEVGVDLFDKKDESLLTPAYLEVMNLLYEKLISYVGEAECERIFNFSNKNQELFYLVDMDSQGVRNIFSQHEKALNVFLNAIARSNQISVVNEIKSIAIKETLMRRLPMPINMYNDSIHEEETATAFLSGDDTSGAVEEDIFK
jgi:glyoxylase-like metal-dependent hydrolase (beta-lactamase superfamily II)